ncbi:TonB-dependent receptor [Pseudomonas sp. RIT-PI-AD]|uniref:TonB-dependent siderophore receptor n=1 Tax=Pseudomonas sp. RIT-PI-AD TaxID=3035294 RepID=UPI0021D7F8DD|nr:TonB-dependent receptor [Pseudomonas sp. RIT-PI-AD]
MSPRPHRLTRRIRFSALALGLSGPLLLAAAPAPAWAQTLSYDIPAGDLGAALSRFAAASGVTISFGAEETAGLRSPGLRGDYALDQGFAHLLQGSGMQVRQAGETRYVLVKPQPGDALELGATTVSANGLGATTEGSRSYTTGAMQTATKLPLSIRETPQAVTVITRQRIEDQGLSNLNEVVQNTPGLILRRHGPERSTYHSRGFSVDNILYDGLPTSLDSSWLSQDLLAADMAIYDRVEVVRGSTGLMQGAGSPSAAINLVRKRPTRDFQASLQGSAGSWDRYRTEVDASGPLTDSGNLRGRVVTAYQNQNSFRDVAENERGLFYGILEADLNDSTTLTLSASHQNDNYNGNGWTGVPVDFDGGDLHLSRSTSLSNDWEYWDRTTTTAFAGLEHALDSGWKLNLSAQRTWSALDMLGTYPSVNVSTRTINQMVGMGEYRERQNSFDLYASGPFSLLGREHQLVLGASHRTVTFEGDVATNRLLASAIDVHHWDSGALAKPAKPDLYDWLDSDAEQTGVYATTRLSLADPLKLILGGRLDWYELDSVYPYLNRPTPPTLKITRNVTRYAGLIYDLNDTHSVYVSYTDIFKPQNYFDGSGNPIQPITGKNYEVGLKGEYFDGALNASLAIFQIDQENRAKKLDDQSSCASYPTTSCYEAAGKVRSKGIELELQGALTPDWQLAAGYTFAEVKYVKDATKANEGQLFDTDIPRHLFKLSTTYTLPGELSRWRVGGALYRQNSIYNRSATYSIEQEAYSLVDLMLGYKPTDRIDARLNLNNAFDKKYYNVISSSVSTPSSVYGEPRNLTLSVKYDF